MTDIEIAGRIVAKDSCGIVLQLEKGSIKKLNALEDAVFLLTIKDSSIKLKVSKYTAGSALAQLGASVRMRCRVGYYRFSSSKTFKRDVITSQGISLMVKDVIAG